jgi:hypothetical protein
MPRTAIWPPLPAAIATGALPTNSPSATIAPRGVEVRQRERHVRALAVDHHRHGDLREVPTGAPG